ncbi:MAG TPA: hypothetical protein PLP27_07375 [Crocinitomicaceae bacterium]|nr:hypothetical protein [Crocinitomicaceae bacterium]
MLGLDSLISTSAGAVNTMAGGAATVIEASKQEGTVDCGSRPSCLGWSKGCKEKIAGYNACVLNAANAKSAVGVAQAGALARQPIQSQQTIPWLPIGIGVAVLVVIILITRR